MIEFFAWERGLQDRSKPWLIFGKGPSFDHHRDFPDVDKKFRTVGLNHICRERKVFVTHLIDANVLDEIPNLFLKCDYLLMPWQPHIQFCPTNKTLQDFVNERDDLQRFNEKERLLWYNASSGKKPKEGSPQVQVIYFSAEAVVRMLAMAGVRVVRTLGIDGGVSYSGAFKDIKPFRGGNTTFDLQNNPINETVRKFGIDYATLYGKPI